MAAKKICLDLRALQIGHEKRGIGMVVRNVIENLRDKENQYIFYCFDGSNPVDELGIDTKCNYKIVQTPRISTVIDKPQHIINFLKLNYHLFRPLRSLKPDVFIQFDFMLGAPRWRKTKVTTIAYDLIPKIYENEYLPSASHAFNTTAGKKSKLKAAVRALYYRFRYNRSYKLYRRSSRVVAISESTRKSFIEILKIKPSKIKTAYLAPSFSNFEDSKADILDNIDNPYIFYVGGTDSRKNIDHLVYTLNIARGRGFNIDLVLAGNELKNPKNIPSKAGKEAILSSPYKKNIHLKGFVSDADKAALYKNALAFVFCTSYEGFGLPVIEAMASGCPVVAYDNSSIPEAAGEAAILVESGNYCEVVRELTKLDGSKRSELIKKGATQSKQFNWSRYCEQLLDTGNI